MKSFSKIRFAEDKQSLCVTMAADGEEKFFPASHEVAKLILAEVGEEGIEPYVEDPLDKIGKQKEKIAPVCRARILAAFSTDDQINISAAAAAGILDEADMTAYRAAIAWVADMRSQYKVIRESGLDPKDDANWPTLPDGVADLVAKY